MVIACRSYFLCYWSTHIFKVLLYKLYWRTLFWMHCMCILFRTLKFLKRLVFRRLVYCHIWIFLLFLLLLSDCLLLIPISFMWGHGSKVCFFSDFINHFKFLFILLDSLILILQSLFYIMKTSSISILILANFTL